MLFQFCVIPVSAFLGAKFPPNVYPFVVNDLAQIMASSLNGLTVGDPLSENLMDSPARSESMLYLR